MFFQSTCERSFAQEVSVPTYAVRSTKDYTLFELSPENRQVCLGKHRKLEESMQKYGFLRCFPMACYKRGVKWVIKDGQHRFEVAKKLNLPVWWVEAPEDFDVADTAAGQKSWQAGDYVNRFIRRGLKAYIELQDFCDAHKISVQVGAKLLSGTVSFSNIKERFYSGDLVVRDRRWADLVATCYTGLCNLSSKVRNARCLEACMCVARVRGFDAGRLLSNAERCSERLRPYSTRDAYMTMLEDVYNFSRKQLVALKIEAEQAMRERSAVSKKTMAK